MNAGKRYSTLTKRKRTNMVLTTGDMIAVLIALGANMILMFVLAYANIQLLKENRFLKSRLKAWRKSNLNPNWEN